MHGWYALRTPPSASPSGANKSRSFVMGLAVRHKMMVSEEEGGRGG